MEEEPSRTDSSLFIFLGRAILEPQVWWEALESLDLW